MNEYWRQPKHHTPAVIDLRPKQKPIRRGFSAWEDLTALRIIKAFGYSIYRFVQILFGLVLQLGSLIIRTKNTISFKQYWTKTQERVDKGIEREIKAIAKPSLRPHSTYFKLLNFVLLLCLLAAPFVVYSVFTHLDAIKNSVTEKSSEAFASLFSGKSFIEKQNYNEAQLAFNQATENFLQAQNDLSEINKTLLDLVGLVPDSTFRLAGESRHILAAGRLSARLGADLASAITPVANSNILSFLDRFGALTAPAAEDADALAKELKAINADTLPEQYREQFIRLRKQAELMAPSLSEAAKLSKQASIFLGEQIDKRYLLVFQNNSEQRGPGGFMGSYALVDFSRGEIKKLSVPKGGTYDTEAGMSEFIVAPKPLWLLNPLWHFWDSNWWPDWPSSAKKIQWFYEKSDGPTVDGVISLTPTVVERLLEIHGPVDMTKDYGVVIDAKNFWEVTQTFSEQKPQVTVEPKKIIGDLISKLMEDLPKNMNAEKTFALIGLLEKSFEEKQILVYLNDRELQASVEEFGWDGGIKKTSGDYLMVSSTNIGGQKTDRVIQKTITHDSQILPDGRIIDTLKLERAHSGEKNQAFVGVRNVAWIRVYVPEGARLISAKGFRQPDASYFETPDAVWDQDPDLKAENEAVTDAASNTKIYTENGKTVFANWSMVDPGETEELEFIYELPFGFAEKKDLSWTDRVMMNFKNQESYHYNFLVQKQPGDLNTTLVSKLRIANGWKNLWNHPSNLLINQNGAEITQALDKDFFSSVLFYKP